MDRPASLGMYDFPWTRAANGALWDRIAASLRDQGVADVPSRLDHDRPPDAVLRDPGLLLGYTCGYPLMTSLRGVVRAVAIPCYDLPGCDGATHRSLIVVAAQAPVRRLDDLRGATVAVNNTDSNTGMNLLRAAAAPHARDGRFFGAVVMTGAHVQSLAAVAAGRADIAAIDCVTHGLTARHRPDLLAGTRVLAMTEATPALPLVTRADATDAEIAILRHALDDAASDPALVEARHALALTGFAEAPAERYQRVLALEAQAARLGYPTLA